MAVQVITVRYTTRLRLHGTPQGLYARVEVDPKTTHYSHCSGALKGMACLAFGLSL